MTSKSTFTVAEVLLVLGIIGIVAALTIPNAIELKDGENTYLNARLDFYNAMLNYNTTAASLEKEVGVPLKFSDRTIFDKE